MFIALGVVLLAGVAVTAGLYHYLQPAPAPVEPPKPAPTARLHVETTPVARIELDRQVVGSSPLDLLSLDPGHHPLVASAAGHHPAVKELDLVGGTPATVTLVLEPLAPPPESPATPDPQLGRLTLSTTPRTRVSLNGRVLGDTPLVEVPLPAGKQVLQLTSPDKRINRTIEVEITAGQTTAKKLTL